MQWTSNDQSNYAWIMLADESSDEPVPTISGAPRVQYRRRTEQAYSMGHREQRKRTVQDTPELDDTRIDENHPLFTFGHRLGRPPRTDRLRELARAPTEKGKRRRPRERDGRSRRERRERRAGKSRDKEARLARITGRESERERPREKREE